MIRNNVAEINKRHGCTVNLLGTVNDHISTVSILIKVKVNANLSYLSLSSNMICK